MGRNTHRRSKPRRPRSQRISRELHESHEESLAHRKHRKKATNKSSTNSLDTTALHPTVQQGKHPPRSYLIYNFKFDCRKKNDSIPAKTYKPKPNRKPTRTPKPTSNHTIRSETAFFSYKNNPKQNQDMTHNHTRLLMSRERRL